MGAAHSLVVVLADHRPDQSVRHLEVSFVVVVVVELELCYELWRVKMREEDNK